MAPFSVLHAGITASGAKPPGVRGFLHFEFGRAATSQRKWLGFHALSGPRFGAPHEKLRFSVQNSTFPGDQR
jgi:hypothetical protein